MTERLAAHPASRQLLHSAKERGQRGALCPERDYLAALDDGDFWNYVLLGILPGQEQFDDGPWDETWCGTRWWMVRDYAGAEPSTDAMDKAIGALTDATVPLTWKVDADGSRRIARPAHHDKDIVRVYERPDGVTVLINEAFLLAIESMVLTAEGEYDEDGYIEPVVSPYKLLQTDNPIGPIAVVTEKDRVVGIVMPIRHG